MNLKVFILSGWQACVLFVELVRLGVEFGHE